MTRRSCHPDRLRQGIPYLLMLLIGYGIGATTSTEQWARAEVRQPPRREAFLSGSERSETVLKGMEAVLKRMDGRLERIERAVTTATRK